MTSLKMLLFVIACTAMITGLLDRPAFADEWDQKTWITTDQPIEVPGRVLPAGKYTFKLMDSLSDRHIVQILNSDESKVYNTILAIPDQRTYPTDSPQITFYEKPERGVSAVQSWFFAGERAGVEFVYPRQQAEKLTELAGKTVPAEETAVVIPDALAPPAQIAEVQTPETAAPVARTAAPPQVQQPETAKTPEAPEAPAAEPTVQSATTLPKTASPDGLFLLIGLVSTAAALGVHRRLSR
jgi:hypothetical protein